MALLWAAGIIWFAVDFAGSGDSQARNTSAASSLTDATGAPVSDEDVQKIADAFNRM